MTDFLEVKTGPVANLETLVKQNLQWLSTVFCCMKTKQTDPCEC